MTLSAISPRGKALARFSSPHWEEASAALYGAAVVGVVAGSSGGYLSTTWGWTAVVTLWLAAMALLLRDGIGLQFLELAYLGAVLGFTGWVALSNLWSPSVTSTMQEVQRDIAYSGVVAAGLLIVRSSSAGHLLAGVLVGIAADSLYALGTRLLPDRFGGFDSTSFAYRLSAPITYWNGLGIFATIGFLLALGFATRARHLVARALAAATLPLFTATVYFTFSRGAWYALALGLIAAIAIDPRRLGLIATMLVVAPWPVLTIVEISRRHGLVTVGATLQEATRDGHRLIPVLLVLSAITAASALAAGIVERRLHFPRALRVVFAALLVLAVAVGVAGVWHTKGSPVALARRGWQAFQGNSGLAANGDVGTRLLSLSADGRIPLWKVSLRDFEHAPIIGQGAGTFWEDWARYRDTPSDSTQAHSLYLGAMGELGLVGLLLLVALIAVPVAAAFRARGRELVPLTLGAFVAWAAHAGIDWDWALLGVTAPALLCGVALLKSAPGRTRHIGQAGRVVGVAAIGVLLVAAVPVLVADLRIQVAYKNVSLHPRAALSEANTVRTLEPWSSQPYQVMAEAYEVEGDPAEARQALRRAISKDSSSWVLWRLLANASTGAERRVAEARTMALNPLGGAG